jgi:hypothetical protein
MPVAPATPEQIKVADEEYQSAVAAQQTAASDYDGAVEPFVTKRRALRAANSAVAEKRAALVKLVSSVVDPSVPPLPSDEE